MHETVVACEQTVSCVHICKMFGNRNLLKACAEGAHHRVFD